jgi:DNA helicase-2/ATP-dependent DNA helicase PcrA
VTEVGSGVAVRHDRRVIQCGCCDGEHETVAETRACCAERGPGPSRDDDPPPPDEEFADEGFGAPDEWSADAPVEAPDATVSLQAPAALGRSLVVERGGSVPDAWSDAPRFVVDPGELATSGALIDRLHELWATRRPYVIEMAPDAALDAEEVEEREPWQLDPSFSFPAERLDHLVTANAVDLRDPDQPRFAPLTAAVAAGGRTGTTSDMVDRDGAARWCDGGPLDVGLAATVPLVPAVSLEHRRLEPLEDAEPSCQLAPDQLAAVRHRGGPCRVISPAGSGKTRTLTERARHLLAGWKLPPATVCLVAYNKRAAEEMAERLPDLAGLQIRTLNALALAIVNGTGPFGDPLEPRSRLSTVDEGEVRRILDGLVDLPRRANTDPTALWLEALAKIRLGLRSPKDVAADYGGDLDALGSVFEAYQAELARRGVLDFDQQIYGAITVLLRDAAARQRARRACGLLLVDEFQDLTPAHLLLLRLLASPRYDLFGVGDDDQTIYGYNGADPRWLIDFDHFFPGARSHPLAVNYRCPPAVIGAADNLLSHNRRRVDKAISPPAGVEGDGGGLRVQTSDETVDTTVSVIRAHLDDGVGPDRLVVLTRVNAGLAPVQVALSEAGIPVEPVSGPDWLQRTGVRAALAWLALAADPGRLGAGALAEASRRPGRGLSRVVGGWIAEQRSVADLRGLAGRMKKERDRERIAAFADDVDAIAGVRARGAAAVLTHVRDQIGLGSAVNSLDTSRNWTNRASHGDDLDALIQLAALHDDVETFPSWLRDRLGQPAATGPRVQLHTVHRVKGLEWPHVVIHEASARLFPHHLADDREEERRIFHVALTRCSASVTVVAPAGSPSPFLAELDEKLDPADLPPEEPEPARPRPRSGPDRPPAPEGPLADALRAWRRERAQQREVPAYVIFADRTLEDLLARRPSTRAELGACHGIGPTKLEAFGDDLLAVISRAGGEGGSEPPAGAPDRPSGSSGSAGPPAGAPDRPSGSSGSAGPPASAPDGPSGSEAPAGLAERLRSWRREQARVQDVPAYRVFTNKTLDELCARVPTDDRELLACSGIGPAKLEAFGPELLAVIADAVDEAG